MLEYIQCGENVGFGRANNIGIAKALEKGADYIGIINPDVWFEPGWFEPILSSFGSYADYGMLAPLQLEYEGNGLSEWARKVVGAERVSAWRPSHAPLDVSWIEGSAMIIRGEVFEKIGGFDEIFDMFFEDNDLCRRARLAGYKIGVAPDSRYHHLGSGSFGGNHSIERNIRCSLSHLIYAMTDPAKSIAANSCEAAYMLAGLGWGWLAGRHATFPHIAARFVPSLWRKREAIRKKRRRERILAGFVADTQKAQREPTRAF
jgi:GT2 family glycosyltransferase